MTANKKTRQPKEAIAPMMKKLRLKAKAAGADAVIILDKKVKLEPDSGSSSYGTLTSAKQHIYKIKYTAQAITLCDNIGSVPLKHAKYDSDGSKVLDNISYKLQVEQKFTFFDKTKTTPPLIEDHTISTDTGIYGVMIDAKLENVIATLGNPSVQLTLTNDELVIGYGRSHWFYFQKNKLVKVQSENQFLSQNVINQIPLREFFDDEIWRIDDKISTKMSLAEVEKLLNINPKLNNENQLIINNGNTMVTINFSKSKNHHNGEESITVNGFALQKSDHQFTYSRPQFNNHKLQLEVIADIYEQLTLDNIVDLSQLQANLGNPIASIILSKRSRLDLYNPNLMVIVKNNELAKIVLSEGNFTGEINSSNSENNWSLGAFIKGRTYKELSESIPENAFELEDTIEISSDSYTLHLFFDENDNNNVLYEAEIELW